jgi:chemotaxis protein MotB
MPRRAKRDRGEHNNHERWLISYADFITLLFAFFVAMYAISSVNEGKFRIFSQSLTSAFGQAKASGPVMDDKEYLQALVDRRKARKQSEAMQKIVKDLNLVMGKLVQSGLVNVKQTDRGVEMEINASALFDVGEATINPEATSTLAEVAKLLSDGSESVLVEGFTDDVPISTPRYPSNWELSAARASSVVRLFIDHGVAAGRLTAIGQAEKNPVAPNTSPEGRARNRRIAVIISPQPEPSVEPAQAM